MNGKKTKKHSNHEYFHRLSFGIGNNFSDTDIIQVQFTNSFEKLELFFLTLPTTSTMEQFKTDSTKSKSEIENALLLVHLSSKKWKYILVSLACGLVWSLILKFYIIEYQSTGSFYVNDMSVLSSAGVDIKSFESLSANDNTLRIFELINSSKVKQHLIKKFDLVKHYGVDSTREFYFQQTENILTSNITVKNRLYNTITITIQDNYRYLAADIANEIMYFIDEINKQYFIKNVQSKLKISEAYLKNVKADNELKSKSIDSLLTKMHEMVQTDKLDRGTMYIMKFESLLSNLMNELANSTRDLTNSQKLYNLALQALSQKDYQTITIVQSATPASNSTIFICVAYGALISVMIASLLIFRAYIYIHYKDEIRILFDKK